jgi:hypothetical protein
MFNKRPGGGRHEEGGTGLMCGSESSTSSVPAQNFFRSSKRACLPRCMLTILQLRTASCNLVNSRQYCEPYSSSVCCVYILTYWDSIEVLAQSNANGMPPSSFPQVCFGEAPLSSVAAVYVYMFMYVLYVCITCIYI